MDVEKLQKINALARELLQHKMASSMDDAVKMAEEQLRGKPIVSEIRQTMEPPKPVQEPQKEASSDEVKRLMKKVDEHASVIDSMSKKMNEMISEINNLQSELKRVKTIQVPEGKEQSKLRPPEKKEAHAKVGIYNPDDVSIEKMFYFGQK